jgi:hypothetical protein
MTQAQDNPKTNNDNAGSASSSLTPRAGIMGLQCGAIFALCFSLIGYSISLSLILGAIGGVAISILSNWWESDDETVDALQVSFSDEEIYGLRRRNRRIRQKQYLATRNRYLSRRARKHLTGLFFETGVVQLSPPDRSDRSAQENKGGNEGNSGDES